MDAPEVRRLRGRLAEIGVQRQVLAMTLGLDPSRFSAILHGRRRASKEFLARAHAALDIHEAAEQAAAEARERKFAELAEQAAAEAAEEARLKKLAELAKLAE